MVQGKSITVLVTGVGAIIGQGIVKSLSISRYEVRIVGVDRTERTPGGSKCGLFFKKPPIDENNSEYLNFWEKIIQEQRVDLVLPGIDIDVYFFDKQRRFFESLGVAVALNTSALINLAADKWEMGLALAKQGLPSIPSVLTQKWSDAVTSLGAPPLLLKPRRGSGSRGILLLHQEDDFLYWKKKIPGDLMLQRIVGSDEEEFTVGLFGFGNGEALEPIIFKRRLSTAGSTISAEVVHDDIIKDAAQKLTEIFRPLGPTNYQFRKEGNTPYLLEVNPRFSSSNSLRTAFGYNESEMAIEYFLLGKKPDRPKMRTGTAWRYTEDFVSYDGGNL